MINKKLVIAESCDALIEFADCPDVDAAAGVALVAADAVEPLGAGTADELEEAAVCRLTGDRVIGLGFRRWYGRRAG